MTGAPLRIGIAGLGTVGGSALKILLEQKTLLAERCGRPIEVAGVSAREQNKQRRASIKDLRWFDDPLAMAADAAIDVIVETTGGADGVAHSLAEKTLLSGKSLVTANKALIARHGVRLAALAEKHNATLAFEAAVAGGIPIVKALQGGLAANRFTRIVGVLNGTCNYILTAMEEIRRSFDEVLREAQREGYAEADPGFDIDGIDTAHKLAILAGLAYGCPPAIDRVAIEGIRGITPRDIKFAADLGYVIKLLGIAGMGERGLEQRVHLTMIPAHSPLAGVRGAYNAVLAEGDAAGAVLFEGRGAGGGPTASSVVADLMDIARGIRYHPFTLPVGQLKQPNFAGIDGLHCSYYLRLAVIDRPGVLADVTGIFKTEQISLRSVVQHAHQPGDVVQLFLTTHRAQELSMQHALRGIERLDSVKEKPYMIRIEEL